jgi:molybdopterin molybdotransferase
MMMDVISVDEALAIILKHAEALPTEGVALDHARGRVLREDVRVHSDQPPFTRAGMDGYAIRDGDKAPHFAIASVVKPGETPDFALEPGQCARIFSGSGLPREATRVVPLEDAEIVSEQTVRFKNIPTDKYIRHQGEEARAGEILVKAGHTLKPADLAILASVGLVRPSVTKVPRVVHFVSGDELVEPQAIPNETQIRDANSTLIASLVGEVGARIIQQQRVPDEIGMAIEAVNKVPANMFDVVLFSGGVSVGAFDFCQSVLQNQGYKVCLHGVNVRPGKLLIVGARGKQLAFGIPGNPVSHFVTFHLFIRPALMALMSGRVQDNQMSGQLATDFNEPASPREAYWPSRWSLKPQGLILEPLDWKSTGHLSCLSHANALLKIPADSGPLRAGTQVQWLAV